MTIFKYTKAQLYRLGQTCKLMLAAEDWQRLKDHGIRAAVRGCRAGKKKTKQQPTSHIPTRVTQRPSADRVHKGRQHGRGVYKHVATVDSLTSTVSSRTLAAITCKHRSAIKMCLLNPCSVCNKTSVLQDFVTDHNIDLMVLTETWLKGDYRDNVILAELQPPGYSIKHKARQGRGGGVAIMHPSTLSVTRAEHSVSSPPQYASFEELQCLVHTVPAVRLAVIYRPPPSKTNGLNYKTLYAEIGNYIEQLVLTPGALVIAGDFNIHVDDHSDKEAADFLSLIESFGLKQHVSGPTHRTGHTLDLVLTRDRDSLAPIVSSQDHCFPDHFPVFCDLSLTTEYSRLQEVTYRKIKAIDADCFIRDVSASVLCSTSATTDIDADVALYNNTLSTIVNMHAAEKTRKIPARPQPGWYNEDIRVAKQSRRQAERLWRKTRLTVHHGMFREKCRLVCAQIQEAKKQYYLALITDSKNDARKLFGIVNNLLGRRKETVLPTNQPASELVDMFSKFFNDKIANIHRDIGSSNSSDSFGDLLPPVSATMDTLPPVSSDELFNIIMASPSKSCNIDPLPTSLLKTSVAPLLPFLTDTMNKSMSTGVVPHGFKVAQVSPKLKKACLDQNILANYRPISNLTFLSKVLERVVAARLVAYLEENKLSEPNQSAYRKGHSTETALVRVQHDILNAIGGRQAVLLVLLDLSAAFDTVSHAELISTLQRLEITGRALQWFTSYLTDREQYTQIGLSKSSSEPMRCGVPQGSVLGPILFTIYTTSLGSLFRSHNMNYQLYFDDSQTYVIFKPTEQAAAVQRMETCLASVVVGK